MTIQKRLARSNNVHLLNRGGVQYDPTGTTHSIGD